MDGVLSDSQFILTSTKLESRKSEISSHLSNLKRIQPEFSQHLSNATSLLNDLSTFYLNSDGDGKKKIIGSIFPEKIYFEENSYRTAKINDVVELICSGSKGLKQNNPVQNTELSRMASP